MVAVMPEVNKYLQRVSYMMRPRRMMWRFIGG